MQYYSYSNKDYWAFVSANEKTQLQKEGKLPVNMDHDDVPGAEFESSVCLSEDENPAPSKKVEAAKAPKITLKDAPKASSPLAKKGSQPTLLNKRLFKQTEKR